MVIGENAKPQDLAADSLRSSFATKLSLADDEAFLRLLWALNALQTGRAEIARSMFRALPEGAETRGILGPLAIYPWELETLANELFTTPKDTHYRLFDCRGWGAVTDLVNNLRALENAEYGVRRHELHIFREMGRIGARQFEWQRGFFTLPELYRSAYIYGQGQCAAYLIKALGVTSSDLTLVGFGLMSVYLHSPVIWPAGDLALLQEFGVSEATVRRVIQQIAKPHAAIRKEATVLRPYDGATAYRPSILRRYPCVLAGLKNSRMLAPLPDLVAHRLTSGLFYDVIGGGGPVRAEIGRRFESYSHALLSEMLPTLRFEREWSYVAARQRCETPDILLVRGDETIGLIIECKAGRMNMAARFGEDPAGERGYEEIARGVFQIWRFCSHCRRGLTGRAVAADAKGLVLALDEWFAARSTILELVLQRANALADESASGLLPEDRRPIAFCSISELEVTLGTATEQSFLSTIDVAVDERQGWIFSSLHAEFEGPKTAPKPYPFEAGIGELLPWYDRVEEAIAGAVDTDNE